MDVADAESFPEHEFDENEDVPCVKESAMPLCLCCGESTFPYVNYANVHIDVFSQSFCVKFTIKLFYSEEGGYL